MGTPVVTMAGLNQIPLAQQRGYPGGIEMTSLVCCFGLA